MSEATEVKKGLTLVDGEKTYKVRELNAGDTRTVGSMIATVTGDPRLQSAVMSGEENVMIMSAVACVMDRVPRQLALWCASLIGIQEAYNVDDYIRREREAALLEDRDTATVGELRYRMEEDIIAEIDAYPAGAYMDIIAELLDRDSFDDFLVSSSQLGAAISKVSTKLRNRSKKGSAGKTTKS